MAGAYNANVLRALGQEVISMGVPQQAICVGRYAALHVASVRGIDEKAAYPLDTDDSDLELARPILREAVQAYLDGSVDAVSIIYTRFISTVKQEVVTQRLLPVPPPPGEATVSDITFEPDPEALLEYATRRLLEAQLVQAMLESRAGEQAARMLAMMNATDNAGELIEDLTLAYNNARQAAITQQISEISAGAEAMNQ